MKMKLNLTILVICLLSIGIYHQAFSQGCVAIRNMSCSGATMSGSNPSGLFDQGQWQVSLGYRHFKSFRHFRGKHEEANRVEEGTEVINLFHSADLGVTYGLSNRWTFSVTLPIVTNDRSSLYEHYGNSAEANPDRNRFHTYSAGIGDLRVAANYWLFDPTAHHTGNIAVGLGIKAPTGKADVEDDFHKLDENGSDYTIRQPVDQSIQLGDGGWGVNFEMQAFQALFHNTALYFNGFYMSNPRNVNNTLRRANLDPSDPFNYFSVADQYAARLGLNYFPTSNLSLSFGGRIEGIPAHDIIGKEEGFRRPGYVISIEPGISYIHNQFAFSLNVPVAVERDRIQNVQDIMTGRHGDAAFADYLINAGIAYRFSKKKEAAFRSWEDLNKD